MFNEGVTTAAGEIITHYNLGLHAYDVAGEWARKAADRGDVAGLIIFMNWELNQSKPDRALIESSLGKLEKKPKQERAAFTKDIEAVKKRIREYR